MALPVFKTPLDVPIESLERRLEPIAQAIRGFFENQFRKSREAEELPLLDFRTGKPKLDTKGKPITIAFSPAIGGLGTISKSVSRIFQKAVGRGISIKGLNKVLKIRETQLKPLAIIDDVIKEPSKLQPKKIEEATKQFITKARVELTDRFAPIANFKKTAERVSGKTVPLEDDPYIAARLYQGVMGKIEGKLETLGSAIKIAGTHGSTEQRQLSRLLLAERIKERALRGFKNPGNLGVKQADEAIALIKKDPKFPQIQKAQLAVYKFADDLLLDVKNAGIIDEASFKSIKANNQRYTPFDVVEHIEDNQNVIRAGKTFNVATQDAIKAIRGTTKDVIDPLEAYVRKTAKVTALIERNKVTQKFVGLRNLSKEMEELIVPIKSGVAVPSGMEKISVFRNGVKEDWATLPEVADSMKGMNEQQMDMVTKMFSKFTSIFRAGVTVWNASFHIPNAIRDIQTAITVSKSGFRVVPDLPIGFAASIGKSSLYKLWRNEGGAFSTAVSQYTTPKITLKEITQSKAKGFIKTIVNPVKLIQEAGRVFEETTRLAVFRSALRRGETARGATFEARQATVDFSKAGTKIRIANLWIPFLNARLQGTLNVVRAVKERPTETILKATTMIGVPTISTYLWNRTHELYWEIPQYVKDHYFIIMTGEWTDSDGNVQPKYIQIPRGDIGRYIGNPLENFLVFLDGQDSKSLDELALQFFSDLSPVGFEREGVVSGERFLNDVLPPPLKVLGELTSNRKFFTGRPIIPRSLQEASPELQTLPWTGESARVIGEQLGISPAMIEHFTRQIFGEVGAQAMSGFDIIVRQSNLAPDIKKEETSKLEKLSRAPVIGRFIGITGGASEQRMWEELDKLKTESVDARIIAQQDAQEVFEAISSAITVEAKKELIEEFIRNGTLNDKVADSMLDEINKIDSISRAAKVLPIPQRAEFIVSALKQKKTPQEKKNLLEKLIEDKVLTNKVADFILLRGLVAP